MLIQISAGELSEFCFPEGSLGVMPTLERMFEGTSAHKKLQNIYKEDESIKYEKEVPLEYTENFQDFSLKIQGRADGIFFDKKSYYIHEIKSTYCAAESIKAPLKRAHKAQMMIYACIYAQKNGLKEIKGRLSYYCLNDNSIVDFEYSFPSDALLSVFKEMINEYGILIKSQIKYRKNLVKTVDKLQFPFKTYRKGQKEGAKQIYSALSKNKNLFLQAPTGTGKTLMALFPAVKYLKDEDTRIFCLNAKNQTMTVTEQALDLMRKDGLKIKSTVINAKAKCCPMEKQDCTPDYCPYSENYYKKVHDALPEILKEDNFNYENIKKFSEKYQICPYELSLELSLFSSVIIGDYNYLFDPVVYLKRFFDSSGNYIFLIDEAHNLIERGRDMYSFTIEQQDLREIKKLFSKEHPLYKSFGKILTQLNKLIKQYSLTQELTDSDLKNLVYAILQNNEVINKFSKTSLIPSQASLYQKELLRFNTIVEYYNCNDFSIFATSKNLSVVCLDPSEFLENSIQKGSSCILYSATLTPYDFYKNSILPNSESFGYLTEYPFDPNNLKVFADYSIDTRYANREKNYSIIAQKIDKYYQQVKGNVLIYFPSYKFMNEVFAFMETSAILQPSDADQTARQAFLDNFKENGNVCALAIMGSHFSEGIDIKHLNGIIIVGVALPQFNETRNLIQQHFEEKYKKGFEYAYTYPGINKVCQASGRLIRNENDKGFIILMDDRFRKYKNLLPNHWNITTIKNDVIPNEQQNR
ncbi:MAG: DEAD/DEAH box helicase [Clostridiales bacterium]|nr:DEAD/DEAH box helicase [Clostridiales bacterium]